MSPLLARLGAATVLVAAAVAIPWSASPAQAAACGSADGVTVVVDFHELGGGVQQACDADGGGSTAATLFTENGFPLTFVQRQPGFVCRVSGKPASDPCVNTPPTNAYWGLYWSKGDGTWKYSSVGVAALKIPEGGAVALSWQGSSAKSPPGAPAPDHASDPPAADPSQDGGSGGGGSGGGGTGGGADGSGAGQQPSETAGSSAAASASASASRTPKPSKSPKASRSAAESEAASLEAAESPSASAEPTSGDPDLAAADSGDGLPGWVVPLVLVGLLGAAGATAYARRSRGVHGP